MQVQLNGEPREVTDGLTLAELLNELNFPSERIAVELNQHVIRRQEWIRTLIKDQDRLEIVHFVGGGAPSHGVPSFRD